MTVPLNKIAHTAAHLNAESFWWGQCSVKYCHPLPSSPGISDPDSTSQDSSRSGESVEQSKSILTLSKPVLSTMGRGHQLDGRPLRAGLCARPEISPDSNLQKTFRMRL